MKPSTEQQAAAKKVVEAAYLLQYAVRQAEDVGLDVAVVHLSYTSAPSEIRARVSLIEEQLVATTDKGKK